VNVDELDYALPPERIAQAPTAVRDQSRLLILDRSDGSVSHGRFSDLPRFLHAGDVLVLNETRVLPARFAARRQSGGRVEGLFLLEVEAGVWEVMLKPSARLRVGEVLATAVGSGSFELIASLGGGRWRIRVDASRSVSEILETIGTAPLPPYIKRGRTEAASRTDEDRTRYQTVYAVDPGSVAAPTAGLHFTEPLLTEIEAAGVTVARLTLHVGLGTFQPVSVKRLEDHDMHREWYDLPAATARSIESARQGGGRIVAVGTTSVRVLETCATSDGQLEAASGWTDLLISPPYAFRAVDTLVTNFHLPRSTLLALVFAFAGRERILAAYDEAIREGYRFYSYGDAMLVV